MDGLSGRPQPAKNFARAKKDKEKDGPTMMYGSKKK